MGLLELIKGASLFMSVKGTKTHLGYIMPALIFIVVIFLIPISYTVAISFFQWNLLRPDLGMKFIGFNNYFQALKDPFTWQSIGRTFYFVILSVLLELIIGFAIALSLNTEFKGWKIVQTIILIPFMIAPVVVGFTWKFVANNDYGPLSQLLIGMGFKSIAETPLLASPNTAMLMVILADVWEYTPFVTLVLLAGLKSIPQEPYEAAYVDGASSIQRFFYITLPLLRPSIMVAVVIRTLTSLRVFDTIFIMTGGGPGSATETLSFYGYRMAFQSYEMGYSSTINLISFVLAIVFTLFYMKLLGGNENE